MKSTELMKSLRGKTAAQLNEELAALRKEQFNLRMQYATGQLPQTHRLSEVKVRIARLKTVMQQQAKVS